MLPSIYGENMLDDFFGTSFFGGHDPLFGKHGRNLMKTDIRETDDAVSAEKGLDKDEEDKKGRILRQERYAGACSRSFYVGDVKPEDVKAKYEHGVLTILVPKHDSKKLTSSSKVTIE